MTTSMTVRTLSFSFVALIALSIPSTFAQKARPHTLNSSVSPQALAPLKAELLYVPLPVCRAIFTSSSSGTLKPNAPRNFYVVGSGTQFTTQGGSSAGCGVPASAAAVAISFTALNALGSGGLLAYAAGAAQPTDGRVLSFQNSAPTTASAVVPLSNNQITLAALTHSTQIQADVTGYYVPQIEAFIDSDGTLDTGTNRILSVAHTSGSGAYTITADTNIYDCAITASVAQSGGYISAVPGSNTTIVVRTWTLNSSAAAVPADRNFNLGAHC